MHVFTYSDKHVYICDMWIVCNLKQMCTLYILYIYLYLYYCLYYICIYIYIYYF